MHVSLPAEEGTLSALRTEFRARGFYERPLGPILFVWIGHIFLALGGLAACLLAANPVARAAALVISTYGFVGLGAAGHTASHGGASPSPFWNRLIFYISHPLLLQLSASYWRHSHVQIHHPAPNIIDVDNDCDLRPLFALNVEHLESVSSLFHRWPALQGLLLPFVLPLNGLNILRQSWAYLLRELVTGTRRTPERWLDLGCLFLHVLLFLGLPMLYFSPADVLLFFLYRIMLIGVGLFAILAPGHYPEQAACLSPDQVHAGDHYFRQGATTVNFRTGFIGRFLCSGLEYQIEHHMFPSVSNVHYSAMAPLVREFCRRSGIPYHTMGWGEAIWQSWRTFFYPKPVVADTESLRRLPPTEPLPAAHE